MNAIDRAPAPRPTQRLIWTHTAPLLCALLTACALSGCTGRTGGDLILPDASDAPSGDAPNRDASDDTTPPDDATTAADATPDGSRACQVATDCDDGLFCNGPEACAPDGTCQAGAPPACADAVACTRDLCDEPARRCLNLPDLALCDGGDLCHPLDGCVPLPQCFDAADCDDGAPCTEDLCVNGACRYSPDPTRCDPGDFCTSPQVCAPFLGCLSGVPRACDDGDPCTADACDPTASACAFTPLDPLPPACTP